MPVPKRQHSKSRSLKRAAGKHKVQKFAGSCQTCSAPSTPHTVCESCGFYRGVKMFRTKSERTQERTIVRKIKERSMKDNAVYRKLLEERLAQNEEKKE